MFVPTRYYVVDHWCELYNCQWPVIFTFTVFIRTLLLWTCVQMFSCLRNDDHTQFLLICWFVCVCMCSFKLYFYVYHSDDLRTLTLSTTYGVRSYIIMCVCITFVQCWLMKFTRRLRKLMKRLSFRQEGFNRSERRMDGNAHVVCRKHTYTCSWSP